MLDSTIGSVKRYISVSLAPPDTPKIVSFTPIQITDNFHFGSLITDVSWSPVIFQNNRRHEDNFLKSDFIALDVDGGMPLKESIAIIKEWECLAIIGTTKSHQKQKGNADPCDRYRIIFPMATACSNIEQFRYNVRLYFPIFKCDGSCRDGARFFYRCANVVFNQDGWPMDWRELPADYMKAKERAAVEMSNCIKEETLPHWVIRKVAKGVPPGGGGQPGRHSACYSIAWAMTDLGYSIDAITQFISSGPLIEIGAVDVRRQVEWGAAKAKGYRPSERGLGAHKEKASGEADASPAV